VRARRSGSARWAGRSDGVPRRPEREVGQRGGEAVGDRSEPRRVTAAARHVDDGQLRADDRRQVQLAGGERCHDGDDAGGTRRHPGLWRAGRRQRRLDARGELETYERAHALFGRQRHRALDSACSSCSAGVRRWLPAHAGSSSVRLCKRSGCSVANRSSVAPPSSPRGGSARSPPPRRRVGCRRPRHRACSQREAHPRRRALGPSQPRGASADRRPGQVQPSVAPTLRARRAAADCTTPRTGDGNGPVVSS
jgi:hypothetical protein